MMSVVTLRIPDAKHERLKQLASSRHTSVNRLLDELATIALVQYDLAPQFHEAAQAGDPDRGRATRQAGSGIRKPASLRNAKPWSVSSISIHQNKFMRTISLLILIFVSFLAHADAYKCKEAGGRVVFSSSPCPEYSTQVKTAQSANTSDIQYQRAQYDLERQRAWLRGREAEQRTESRSAPVSVVQDNYGNTEKIHACLMAVTATSGLSPYNAGSRRVNCFAGTKGRVDECESSVAATPLLTIAQESNLKARCRSM